MYQLGFCYDVKQCVLAVSFSWFKCCKTIKTEEATDQQSCTFTQPSLHML